MKVRRYLALSLLAAAWVPSAQLQAQERAGRFALAPRVSYEMFDGSSALKDAWMLGFDALYFFGESGFALGFGVDVSRPETDGEFFTPIRLDFGPESELRFVGLRTTVVQVGLQAMYGFFANSRFAPYLVGGGGGYVIYPDNQQQTGFDKVSGLAANFGAGLDIGVGESTGFRLEVQDFVYFDYNREDLNVVAEEFRDDRFPEMHGNPPDPKSTIHNIRLSLSFVFVPSR